MISDDEPCFPFEPFVKELKRIYTEKWKEDFSDFFITTLWFLDEVEKGNARLKDFKTNLYQFARFFIPLENLTRVMVNNLKTKEERSEKEDRECYDGKVVEQHMIMNDSNHL